MPDPDTPESGVKLTPANREQNKRLPEAFVECQFKPGQSGNPAGRPKAKPLTDAYRKNLGLAITQEIATELKLPRSFVGKTIAEAIAIGQAKAAIKGVTLAAREIADRIEGRTAQDLRLQMFPWAWGSPFSRWRHVSRESETDQCSVTVSWNGIL